MIDDLSTEGLHRLAGVQHIIAFKQPLDAGLAKAERPEDQRTMRDRFIPRHICLAPQRPRFMRCHWKCCTMA